MYAKAESFNMTGRIKDRMALHMIECGCAKGVLKPGDLIVEATSGNTGISIAAIGRALGHPAAIFMPDWLSSERIDLMRSEPVREGFLSPHVELLGVRAIPRVQDPSG